VPWFSTGLTWGHCADDSLSLRGFDSNLDVRASTPASGVGLID
jgi:hypothetical protein